MSDKFTHESKAALFDVSGKGSQLNCQGTEFICMSVDNTYFALLWVI